MIRIIKQRPLQIFAEHSDYKIREECLDFLANHPGSGTVFKSELLHAWRIIEGIIPEEHPVDVSVSSVNASQWLRIVLWILHCKQSFSQETLGGLDGGRVTIEEERIVIRLFALREKHPSIQFVIDGLIWDKMMDVPALSEIPGAQEFLESASKNKILKPKPAPLDNAPLIVQMMDTLNRVRDEYSTRNQPNEAKTQVMVWGISLVLDQYLKC